MEFKNRKSIRLKEYDYSTPGAYFVTICVKDRKPILSNAVGANNVSRVLWYTPVQDDCIHITVLKFYGLKACHSRLRTQLF